MLRAALCLMLTFLMAFLDVHAMPIRTPTKPPPAAPIHAPPRLHAHYRGYEVAQWGRAVIIMGSNNGWQGQGWIHPDGTLAVWWTQGEMVAVGTYRVNAAGELIGRWQWADRAHLHGAELVCQHAFSDTMWPAEPAE